MLLNDVLKKIRISKLAQSLFKVDPYDYINIQMVTKEELIFIPYIIIHGILEDELRELTNSTYPLIIIKSEADLPLLTKDVWDNFFIITNAEIEKIYEHYSNIFMNLSSFYTIEDKKVFLLNTENTFMFHISTICSKLANKRFEHSSSYPF